MSQQHLTAPGSVRPHVLVVTDDPDLRDFLQEALLYGGFWVSVIASALQVLEVFRLRSFDIALIDAAIPGLSAVELAHRLRDLRETNGNPRADIPLVVIADRPAPDRDAAAIAAGVDTVLTPPIEVEVLIPELFARVAAWRAAHPDRPWADQAAALPVAGQPHTRDIT